MKKEIQYNGLKYTRLFNNDVAEDIESVFWFYNGVEVLDTKLTHDLENHYELTLINEISPILPII